MAKFHGPTNLQLGDPEKPWASAEYDHETNNYAVDVDGDDLKKFRAVADEYGYVEDKAHEAKPAAKKAAAPKADKEA